MTTTIQKLTSAQQKTIRAKGVDTSRVYVRRNPGAPKGKEREVVVEAYKRLHAEEQALGKRKAELVKEFLRTDPDAAAVVAELEDLRTRKAVVGGRRFARAVEICRDGEVFTHVLGQGDTFADAASEIREGA